MSRWFNLVVPAKILTQHSCSLITWTNWTSGSIHRTRDTDKYEMLKVHLIVQLKDEKKGWKRRWWRGARKSSHWVQDEHHYLRETSLINHCMSSIQQHIQYITKKEAKANNNFSKLTMKNLPYGTYKNRILCKCHIMSFNTFNNNIRPCIAES